MSRRTYRKTKGKADTNEYEIKKRLNESSIDNMITNCKSLLAILPSDDEQNSITLALLKHFLIDNGLEFIKCKVAGLNLINKEKILPESMMVSSLTRRILLDTIKPDHKKQLLSTDLLDIKYLSINGVYTVSIETQVDAHKFIVLTSGRESTYIGSYGICDKFNFYKTTSSNMISYIQRAYQDSGTKNSLIQKRIAMNLLLTNMSNKEHFTDDFVGAKCTKFVLKRVKDCEIKDFDYNKLDLALMKTRLEEMKDISVGDVI